MKWLSGLRNKGFTLVEIIIAIAILTIVGGVIGSFVLISQKQYNYGASETDIQYEAQLLVNQLQELLIDASKEVSME